MVSFCTPTLHFLLFLCFFLQCHASLIQHEARLLSSPTNSTNLAACRAITPQSKVSYPLSASYVSTTTRYMTSYSQNPTCVFIPTLPSELSAVIKLVGQKRVQFAVSSGRHASNQGFSSTTGVHISLKGFQQVNLSSDKTHVDIGPGNVWDNVYQVLNGMYEKNYHEPPYTDSFYLMIY